jgi:hypothetical protein
VIFKAKQMELHMTIGDCLVAAALGAKSPLARDFWTTAESDFKVKFYECSW